MFKCQKCGVVVEGHDVPNHHCIVKIVLNNNEDIQAHIVGTYPTVLLTNIAERKEN